MKFEKKKKKEIRKVDLLFIIIVLIVGAISIYALYNIDKVEDRCDQKWRNKLKEAGIINPDDLKEDWAIPIDYENKDNN